MALSALEYVRDRAIRRRIVIGDPDGCGKLLPRLQSRILRHFLQRLVELGHQRVHVLVILVFQQHHEFVAADAEHRGMGENHADDMAELLDGNIALLMSKGIIDALQIIEVDHRHAEPFVPVTL